MLRRFQALVEREWLQAGYPFQKRHSRGCFSTTNTGRTKANGATFLLFLDCVWQIQNQFLCSFEFSPSLLILLFEHSYSSEYGEYFLRVSSKKLQVFNFPSMFYSFKNFLICSKNFSKFSQNCNPIYPQFYRVTWKFF